MVIGIDLGGTRVKGVVLNNENVVTHQVYVPTNDVGDTSWRSNVAEVVQQLRVAANLPRDTVVGISAPGISNEENTAIAFMPGRLLGLEGFIWRDYLGCSAYVLNDAISAMMAESRLGVAKGRRHAVMLTLGTGVGGAILIDGQPYQGAFHKAGHLGHVSIDSEGAPDIFNIPGSIEDAIGNHTIRQRSMGRFDSTLALLQAYEKGDHFATWVWLSSVRKLAVAIASLTNIVSPDCVILAGGITEAGKHLFEPLEQFMSLFEFRANGQKTAIIRAEYGDLAGAIGAACFAKEKTLETNSKT